MSLISNADIATGFHAGDPSSMHHTVEMAAEHDAAIGVYPGFHDLVDSGRRYIAVPAIELVNGMLHQLDTLREFVRPQGLPLQHVKPYGALYIHLTYDEVAVHLFIKTPQHLEPGLLLYCMPGPTTWRIGRKLSQPLVCEFCANHDCDRDGSIVLTRRVATLDPQQVADRILRVCREGEVHTVEDEGLDIAFDSACVHNDASSALELVANIRTRLEGTGIHIKAPR